MMFLVTVFVACVGQAVVFGMGYGPMPFRGSYQGSCEGDGMYYSDATHFVFCSNGVSTVQQCAPGTQNSGTSDYNGNPTFCDVNLVDSGYNFAHRAYGPPPKRYIAMPTYQPAPMLMYAPHPRLPMYSQPPVHQPYSAGLNFRGAYQGSCNGDGLYYKDSTTYVVCSHNAATDQHCAPGTRNADINQFTANKNQAFCDVNLVDTGYNNARVYASVPHPSYTQRPAPSGYKPATPTYKPSKPVYTQKESVHKPDESVYKPTSKPAPMKVYQGRFQGKCGNDGIYYLSAEKFVFCSNGRSFEQNCAPGSRNSYTGGNICDINLVDSGYNLQQQIHRGYPS